MWRSGWKRRSVAGLVRYGVLDMSWATDKQGVLPASPGSPAWSKILTAVGNHWKVVSRGMSDQICISKGLSDCRWRTKCGRAEEVREYRGPGGGQGCANTLVILRLPCLPLGIVLRAFSLPAAACVLPCQVVLRSVSQTCPSISHRSSLLLTKHVYSSCLESEQSCIPAGLSFPWGLGAVSLVFVFPVEASSNMGVC